MKKEKTVLEYCSICDEELEMPIVQRDSSNPHLVWVRCPKCNETKPIDILQVADELREEETEEEEEMLEDEEEIEIIPPTPPKEKSGKKKKSKKKKKKEEPAPAVEYEINPEKSREYKPSEVYKPGETIYHPLWKDYGVVVKIRRSGGGRELAEVHFQKQGWKKLLVNQKASKSG